MTRGGGADGDGPLHVIERAWLDPWTLRVRGCDAAAAAWAMNTGADAGALAGGRGRTLVLDGSGRIAASRSLRSRGVMLAEKGGVGVVAWGAGAARRVARRRAARVVVLDVPRTAADLRLASRWARTRWELSAADGEDAAAWVRAGVPADRVVAGPSLDAERRWAGPTAGERTEVAALTAATPRMDGRRLVWAMTVADTGGLAVRAALPAGVGLLDAALRHGRLYGWIVPVEVRDPPVALTLRAGAVGVMDSGVDPGRGVRRVFEAACGAAGARLVDVPGLTDGPRRARELARPISRAIADARASRAPTAEVCI